MEHEFWMQAWHRAVICGQVSDPDLSREDGHLACRFGHWLDQHRSQGILGGPLFDSLAGSHFEVHRQAVQLVRKLARGAAVPVTEYDALIDAMNEFRQAAYAIEDECGAAEEQAVPEDDAAAEMQSRLTMLGELERERERAIRTGTPLCLVAVRPDNVEGLEKEFGRVGLDRVVIGMAARLFSQLRPYDGVYRYGRAAYLLSLSNASAAQAADIARRLVRALEDSPLAMSRDDSAALRARFGIAAINSRSSVHETIDQAIRACDEAQKVNDEPIVIWSPALEK